MAKKDIPGQISFFDFQEPDIGSFIEQPGAVICGIMRPGYICRKVCWDHYPERMANIGWRGEKNRRKGE